MKRFFLFLTFLFPLSFALCAQDTLTVMQYNLLQYGNYQGYGGCSESTNSTQLKDECIRTILNYVKPDVFSVCEFGATQQLLNDFLRHNLNINGVNYWKSDNIVNYAGQNLINHIFYNSQKMELKKRVALRTSPRDTDVYEFYLKTSSLAQGDTTKLVCVVAHPKAGSGYESERLALMQITMAYIDQNYSTENVLIMGDFNMYRASEPGYQLLTKTYSNIYSLFVDPLVNSGGVGNWNNNSQFAQFHTQSTRNSSSSCFSSGGLDDRFDFILMSDEIYMGFNNLKYINNSYYAVGNDGQHFNEDINQNGNSAVPANVAQALYDCSDHLPVTMKIRVFEKLAVEEHSCSDFAVYPNPAEDYLTVSVKGNYRIVNLVGQTVMVGYDSRSIDVSNLQAGIYFLNIDGVTRKFIKL